MLIWNLQLALFGGDTGRLGDINIAGQNEMAPALTDRVSQFDGLQRRPSPSFWSLLMDSRRDLSAASSVMPPGSQLRSSAAVRGLN